MRMARRKDSGAVELRVTYARQMRRWGMGPDMRCTATQWDDRAQRFTSRMKEHTALNSTLGRVAQIAARIVDDLVLDGAWSWQAFDRRFRGGGEAVDVATYMEAIALEMDGQERDGNAAVYRYASNCIRRYTKGKALPFHELTAETLIGMDAMMRKGGAEDGGIGTLMRTVRAAVNRAMKEGLLKPERYPFATPRTTGYEMKLLKKKRVSRALGDKELDKLKDFPFAEYPALAKHVRRFLVMYYARGMNFVDIAHMREPDIHGDRIRYRRRKTIRRVEKVLSIPIKGPLKALLDDMPRGRGGYVLDILGPEHATSRQKRDRIAKCRKQLNEALKEAALIVGIKGDITTYVARHSYAMQLKRGNVDMRKISEAMGHGSMATTEPYMAQFEDPELDATDELL